MAGILRLIAIIATALTILGWTLVAAQTPDTDVERAARQFRIATYQRYRLQRATYDQRIARAEELLGQWRARGAADDAKNVVAWFRQATRATQNGDKLPARPTVGARGFSLSKSDSADVENLIVARQLETHDLGPSVSQLEPSAIQPPDKVVPTIAVPVFPHSQPVPTIAADQRKRSQIRVPRPTVVVPPRALGLRVPGRSHAAVSTTGGHVPTRSPVVQTAQHTTSEEQVIEASAPHAMVDLDLLALRIDAHNRSVRLVEGQLTQKQAWLLPAIESVVTQLDELRQRRQVWLLYWDLLSPHQRVSMGTVESLGQTYELLKQRLFEAQIAYETEPQLASNPAQPRVLARLTEIGLKVNQWKTNP